MANAAALAQKIFNLRKAGRRVPPNVMAAANAAKHGNASPFQIGALRNYLNSPTAQRGGPMPGNMPAGYLMPSNMQQLREAQQGFRAMGGLASSVVNGQWTGYGGHILQSAGSVLQNVQAVATNPYAQAAAARLVGPQGAAAAVARMNAVGKFAGKAAGVLGSIDTAANIVGGVVRLGETMSGLGGDTEALRLARSNAEIVNSNQRKNIYERETALANQQRAQIEANARWMPDSVRSKYVNFTAHRQGLGTLDLAKKDLTAGLSRHALGNVGADELLQEASNRVYAEKFGVLQGGLRQAMDAKRALMAMLTDEAGEAGDS